MSTFEIIVDGVRLTGALAKVAEAAVVKHFADAGLEPYEAALAAFIEEGEAEPITRAQHMKAEVWRNADSSIAKALGLDSEGIRVNLTDDYRQARQGSD